MATIDPREIRLLLRLMAQLRALADPAEWRRHLAGALDELIGARAIVVVELRRTPRRDVEIGAVGVQARDLDEVARARLVEAARAALLSRPRPEWLRDLGFADVLISRTPSAELQAISGILLFRGPYEPPFAEDDRVLVDAIHAELARDWEEGRAWPRLTPRQRQVLALLAEGASEKQIAARLEISTHTAHDHVKAVYRGFEVRSRGELLARAVRTPAPPLIAARQ